MSAYKLPLAGILDPPPLRNAYRTLGLFIYNQGEKQKSITKSWCHKGPPVLAQAKLRYSASSSTLIIKLASIQKLQN